MNIGLIGLTAYNVFCHAKFNSGGSVWNLPLIGLSILMVYLVMRILYFFLLPGGSFQEQPFLSVIFSDLPALLFLTIYSIVVVRWAEIFHFTTTSTKESNLHPVAIGFNVIMYVAIFFFKTETQFFFFFRLCSEEFFSRFFLTFLKGTSYFWPF